MIYHPLPTLSIESGIVMKLVVKIIPEIIRFLLQLRQEPNLRHLNIGSSVAFYIGRLLIFAKTYLSLVDEDRAFVISSSFTLLILFSANLFAYVLLSTMSNLVKETKQKSQDSNRHKLLIMANTKKTIGIFKGLA